MEKSRISLFEEKLKKEPNGCWEWSGSKDKKGYGHFWDGICVTRAHRWSYQYFIGKIPKGLHIHHVCENKSCVNPEHLETISLKEHIIIHPPTGPKKHWNAKKTHCKWGHPFHDINTRVDSRGQRVCRECDRVRGRKKYTEKTLL